MGRISTSSKYEIDITGPYSLSLGEFGGGISSALASSVLLEVLGR